MLDMTRNYTRTYFSRLKEVDLHHVFRIDGKALNTAYWLFAHVTSSENWLVLRGTGGDMVKLPWAKLFNVGAPPPAPADLPPIQEILAASKEVHARALDHVRRLSDDDLARPHQAVVRIPDAESAGGIIRHCIRHEAGHAGQLGLLCKLYGIPTF